MDDAHHGDDAVSSGGSFNSLCLSAVDDALEHAVFTVELKGFNSLCLSAVDDALVKEDAMDLKIQFQQPVFVGRG